MLHAQLGPLLCVAATVLSGCLLGYLFRCTEDVAKRETDWEEERKRHTEKEWTYLSNMHTTNYIPTQLANAAHVRS